MGYLLSAHCPSCGFRHPSFRFGSGMMEQDPKVPAQDIRTGKFIPEASLGDSDLRYYHDPSMYQGELEEDEGIQNGDIFLSPEGNQCPKCGKFTMRFEAKGEWD